MNFGSWVADRRWAANVRRVRKMRGKLLFSQRLVFDEELRPRTNDGLRVAYPDAFYSIIIEDVCRAYLRVKGRPFDDETVRRVMSGKA